MERTGIAFTEGLSPREIVKCVKYAEELGYESAWVAEGHGGDHFTILTACAIATNRILLGTSVSSVYVRSAPTIAMASACVDEFSEGRFILGIGSSHKVQVEGEHGLTYNQPILRIREFVEIIRSLLSNGKTKYKGTLVDIEGFDFWFTPRRATIPIYLGAVNPKMLELCGEISDGIILTRSTIEQTRTAIEYVESGARRVLRDHKKIEIAAMLPCSTSDNINKARDRLRARIATYIGRFPRYRNQMSAAGFTEEVNSVRAAWEQGNYIAARRLIPIKLIDQTAVIGSRKDCLERISAYRSAGVSLPLIVPSVDPKKGISQAMEVIETCAPQQLTERKATGTLTHTG